MFQTSLTTTAIRATRLKDVGIFALNDDELEWSYGVATNGRPRRLPGVLRRAIEAALDPSGEADIYIEQEGNLLMRWSPMGNGRRLYVVSRATRHEREEELHPEEARQLIRELTARL